MLGGAVALPKIGARGYRETTIRSATLKQYDR
jgi:hypothetical protein